MSQSIIRYRTKPDQADANAKLVEAVYAELQVPHEPNSQRWSMPRPPHLNPGRPRSPG